MKVREHVTLFVGLSTIVGSAAGWLANNDSLSGQAKDLQWANLTAMSAIVFTFIFVLTKFLPNLLDQHHKSYTALQETYKTESELNRRASEAVHDKMQELFTEQIQEERDEAKQERAEARAEREAFVQAIKEIQQASQVEMSQYREMSARLADAGHKTVENIAHEVNELTKHIIEKKET